MLGFRREAGIDQSIKLWAQNHGYLWVRLWPFVVGTPDRLLLMPGGRAVFVELKRPGKDLEKVQSYWCDVLRGLGFKVLRAVSSLAELEEML